MCVAVDRALSAALAAMSWPDLRETGAERASVAAGVGLLAGSVVLQRSQVRMSSRGTPGFFEL